MAAAAAELGLIAGEEFSPMRYSISSRDYLLRARERLREGTKQGLFYAALELRSGIEARMLEYLREWEHVSKKKKSGWRIINLRKSVEEAFRVGNKIIRWTVQDGPSGNVLVIFYYTPVTPTLQKHGERLGNYLHAMKRFRGQKDPWWREFREDMEMIAAQLEVAHRGTLLGPPLMRGRTGQVDMPFELPPGSADPMTIVKAIRTSGKRVLVDVSYLDKLPSPLEPEAHVWNPAG